MVHPLTARLPAIVFATSLVAAIANLKSTCNTKPAAVDTALSDVHEAFHRLIEAPPPAPAR